MSLVLVSLGRMEIRFSVLVVLIVFLALNAAVQLRTLAAVQGLAAQQHAISPPGTDAPALEILSTRKVASQGLATQQHAVYTVYAGRRVHVEARLNPIYSTVTQKLRLKGNGFGAAGTGEHLNLQFVPAMPKTDYKVQVLSDTALSINLVSGKSWPLASDEGTYLYLTSLIDDRKGSMNQLENPAVIARVIPTPTVMHGGEKVIYMTGTTRFNINGTGFRAKTMELIFDPPLEKDVDYMLNTRSSTHMQLMLRSGKKWRSDGKPGPLKLRRIDTGAGDLRIDTKYGGVTVAEVRGEPAFS